ncbi:hypothetical protein [Pseudochryseolinea flava]|uniref:Outer membrane protein beta-barrel domain-containing protein n=1 Tax=Pseudochryseolinea flava TaxID=2059302 RepID=A0A364Y3H8_9BACT|nr:hypothetical protein [Pseudochryseolinea flava]RAW01279.1 hypothetical protein DQQ10_10235 [Pseudochryseolinea flava]
MRSFKILVFTIVTFAPFFADAQSFFAIRRNRNLLVGLGSGTANYYGEMVNPGEFGIIKPNITVSAEYYWLPRISSRAQLTWFQFSGDDSKADDDRRERNLSFTSSNIELSVIGVVHLSPMGTRFYQRSPLDIYGFLGFGLLRFNPKTVAPDGEKVALAPLQTEGVKYSRIQPVIPVGLGVRVKVDPFFNILVEGGYRLTFTDYLDDVSIKRYPDPAILSSDLARALSDRRPEIGTQPDRPQEVGVRGNPDENDGYFIANITLQYYLPTEIFRSSQHKLYRSKRKFWNRRR